jgi:hypothetical protein
MGGKPVTPTASAQINGHRLRRSLSQDPRSG